MIKRLRNLWAWSLIDPHEVGGVLDKMLEVKPKFELTSEIVYPSRIAEILKAKPNAGIDEIIS